MSEPSDLISDFSWQPLSLQLSREPGIDVIVASLDQSDDVLSDLEATLNDVEMKRARRFVTDSLQRRFTVGRGLLRRWLAAKLELQPTEVRFDYGEHQKPRLSEDHETV